QWQSARSGRGRQTRRGHRRAPRRLQIDACQRLPGGGVDPQRKARAGRCVEDGAEQREHSSVLEALAEDGMKVEPGPRGQKEGNLRLLATRPLKRSSFGKKQALLRS